METLWTAVFQWEFKMAYIAQNKKITTGRFHFGVKYPLFKGRDRPQWKVIEWRRRTNIIVDEICPVYSDRAEIGSLKVQPQFSITTFPEELILSVLLGVSKRYICCVETISVILFYFIYLFIYCFFWKKDPRLLLSRTFCDRNNRLGDLIFKFLGIQESNQCRTIWHCFR